MAVLAGAESDEGSRHVVEEPREVLGTHRLWCRLNTLAAEDGCGSRLDRPDDSGIIVNRLCAS